MAHSLQRLDFRGNICNLLLRESANIRAVLHRIDTNRKQLSYFREREAKFLRTLDETHPPHGIGRIEPVSRRRARRLGQETLTFVVANRLQVDATLFRKLTCSKSNRHVFATSKPSVNPILRYRVKPFLQSALELPKTLYAAGTTTMFKAVDDSSPNRITNAIGA